MVYSSIKQALRIDAAAPIHEYFSTEKEINQLDWNELFSLANVDDAYVAQGMAVTDKMLYHTVHKKNLLSMLLIFSQKGDQELSLVKELHLPIEASHTSHLSIYNGYFYSLDYHSNYIYKFDYQELKNHLKLKLIKKVRVTKRGRQFGSLEIIKKGDLEYLIINSFAKDNKLYVFDFDKFFNQQLGFRKSLLFSVESSYFTQGLFFSTDRQRLFHSVNRFGVDFIYEINFDRLLQSKNYRESIVQSFLGPNKMIEDIAVHKNDIYTSDEFTNKLYKADITHKKLLYDYVPCDFSGMKYREKFISHRARVCDFQENTLDAFVEVLGTNIKYIELDVRFSSDDVPYIYHDSFFTHGNETFRFSEKTWSEIEDYRYHHKELHISTLEEVFMYFVEKRKPDQVLMLDLKDYGFEKYIYEKCEEYGIIGNIQIFTWTPQSIFAFDEVFKEKKKSFPVYLSHVRTDSMFSYLFFPKLLSNKYLFLKFKDFIFIGDNNYKRPLGIYEKGYRHVPYFTSLPSDITKILKKYKGGVCITKKSYEWGIGLLREYKNKGLRVAIYGAIFGSFKINTRKKFEYMALKKFRRSSLYG